MAHRRSAQRDGDRGRRRARAALRNGVPDLARRSGGAAAVVDDVPLYIVAGGGACMRHAWSLTVFDMSGAGYTSGKCATFMSSGPSTSSCRAARLQETGVLVHAAAVRDARNGWTTLQQIP